MSDTKVTTTIIMARERIDQEADLHRDAAAHTPGEHRAVEHMALEHGVVKHQQRQHERHAHTENGGGVRAGAPDDLAEQAGQQRTRQTNQRGGQVHVLHVLEHDQPFSVSRSSTLMVR